MFVIYGKCGVLLLNSEVDRPGSHIFGDHRLIYIYENGYICNDSYKYMSPTHLEYWITYIVVITTSSEL